MYSNNINIIYFFIFVCMLLIIGFVTIKIIIIIIISLNKIKNHKYIKQGFIVSTQNIDKINYLKKRNIDLHATNIKPSK